MINFRRLFLLCITILSFYATWAQVNDAPVKVAVFAPLHLDDAFTGTTYKLGKSTLPKHILPGLEFYNGVMMAVDSLKNEGAKVEIKIFDTKQDALSLQRLMSTELSDVGLMIAAITNTNELKLFADQALKRNIPLVSATYPNYVGINQNPFFVLLNSSFTAHLEGLYKYMQRNYALNRIVALKKSGNTEDYIQRMINTYNATTPGSKLDIKWVNVSEDVTPSEIARHLDSTKHNIVFVASPLESFGLKAVKTLSTFDTYPVTAIGMPTWDGIRDMNKVKGVEIVYSTPFSYTQNKDLFSNINKSYREKYYSRPSDMVFKGFETTYYFTKLLAKHRQNLINNLSDKEFAVFNTFDIQPVRRERANIKPDYLENKKLYFVKLQDGNVKSVN